MNDLLIRQPTDNVPASGNAAPPSIMRPVILKIPEKPEKQKILPGNFDDLDGNPGVDHMTICCHVPTRA
ncbi:hypothetical protein [Actinomadura pelletieri]|uniref:hypothetical protein n=1 Tax=Actinomadura pelletieri TaxID=111805 RepID=UPI0011C4791A|nr:hypothetical protein [Actinomadura pelletieri]